MVRISDEKLKEVEGGGFHIGIAVGIGAGITFLIGLIDGIIRPLKCR